MKEEEKLFTLDEEDTVIIEEFEVNKKYREGEIGQFEDDLVMDETPNLTTCEDVDIQQKNLQQKSIPKNYFNNKADER